MGIRCAALVLALCAPASRVAASQVTVAYRLTDEPGTGGGVGHWRVEVELEGLRPAYGALALVPIGGGPPADVELLAGEAPMADRSPGRGWTLAVDGRGQARAVYRIAVNRRGSDEHARAEGLPSRGDGYAYGNSADVLLRPTQGGAFLAAEVTVELVAAEPDATLITGWGGVARGRQRVEPDLPWGTSPIVFGASASTTRAGAGGLDVEVFQLVGPDATPHVAALVLRLGPAMGAATGWPVRSPVRVFLSDAMSGGMGGEHGLHLSVPPDARPGFEHDVEFETTVAHELFHEWLGLRLHESHGSLVWFREGFTEYFARWFAAATGVTSREQFAATLEEFDRFARRGTSLGRVAFADAGVNWRDADGPNELMAYRGGPVLALALDVELRAAGEPGLLQLLRDFLAREEHVFPPDDLRLWFVDHGLAGLWRRAVAGRDVPAASDSLVRAGFEPTDVVVDVAYLGLQAVEEKPIWHVTAVDPEGPAARAGVRVGDVIDGFFPFTGAPTRLRELTTPFTFGLDLVTPGIEGSFLELRRDGESLRRFVEPELRPWGLRTGWRAAEATDGFFAFEPR